MQPWDYRELRHKPSLISSLRCDPIERNKGEVRFQGSVINEQGMTFAIAVVKRHVLNTSIDANKAMRAFAPVFGYVPVILMAQDQSGTPTWYGRRDIVNFLKNVPLSAIPWKEYTIN
jgi:hypothetical protein